MHSQRGNILFLILLAVVLFAALSYAVTNSMRGGGNDASGENLKAGTAAIHQYIALMRNEVQRMMLVNGCTAANLDWRDNFYQRYNGTLVNAIGAPPSPKTGCAVFAAQGGPITPQTFEQYKDAAYETYAIASAPTYWKGGHGGVRWVNRKNDGTDGNDLGFFIQGLDANLCRYILFGNTTTAVPAEIFGGMANPNSTVAQITTDVIDDPANITGDFYVSRAGIHVAGTPSCVIGATIVAQ